VRREGEPRAGEQGTKRAGDPALSALAVPTASEAATVEAATVEAATMEAATMEAADTSDMGDAHTVRETTTSKMSDMGDTDAATIHVAHAAHAVAEAMTEGAVVSVAAKYGGVAVIPVIISAQSAANRRIVC
jgi:hypothetical protein